MMRRIRSQVSRVRWLRRRSAMNQCRTASERHAYSARWLPGTPE